MSARPPTSAVPLIAEQVQMRLLERIGRDWKPGDRLPAIPQLARELGVGQTNAYRAVRALAERGLLVSRPRHGTFVASSGQPETIGATPTSERVYLPLGEARDMLVLRMARAATAALERAGLTVVRGPDLAWQDPDLGAIDAGAILLVQPMMVHRLRWSERQSVVIVSTDGETSSHMTSGFDVVTIDQAQGGRLAGEHLRGLGVTDACFFGVYDGLPGDYATLDAQRLEGFERALGRSIPPERRFYCRYYTEESAARLVPEYLRLNPRPRAVFAASDELALGFLIGAAAHGLSAQRDYLLVGFDGQHRARTLTPGPLSTVEVPSEVMGEQAAEFLLSRLRSPALPPRRATLGCTFLAGATTLERARNTAGPLGTLPGRR